MLLKIYHNKNTENLSLIIHLTCFGKLLGETGLEKILNDNFDLINYVTSDSCVASIKFLIPKKYKSKLIRWLNKRRLKKILSNPIKQNKWAFLINYDITEYYKQPQSNINQTYTEIMIKCPDDFNLIEVFENSKASNIEDLNYFLLHKIYNTFKIIKVK